MNYTLHSAWRVTRRVLAACHAALLLASLLPAGALAQETPRPNVLWITSEDHGPQLGCYGDSFATTPHVDKLAARGLVYRHVWSCAPVCAPARTTLISGMYPPSTGGEHMRSLVAYPAGKQMFPQILRAAGYYCSNNQKEDYNLAKPGQVWDESSASAHWRKRKTGQPFFAVFNSTKSHESQVIRRPHTPVHDPAKVRVPAYHPDTPEVRRDWAQYYDQVSEADADAGRVLAALEQDGLAENTVVFYFADHGPGLPRSKRWPCDSGLHVPLVVHIPEKFKALHPVDYQPGGKSDRLVSFVDFAPTVLSLAGIQPPEWMQGHAFLGKFSAPPQPYIYGFRGRMDERYDLVRSATDGRYVYLRNYMPHLSQAQFVSTQFKTPTTQVWKRLFDEDQLNAGQRIFWQTPKPPEELHDLHSDPDEVQNLADSPAHQEVLAKLRNAQRDLALRIRDTGFIPEGERLTRAGDSAPYDFGHDDSRYPLERVLSAAELASSLKAEVTPELKKLLNDSDSSVRYWGALGLLMRGAAGAQAARNELTAALQDKSPDVRIVAAEALGQHGNSSDLSASLTALTGHADWQKHDVFTVMAAVISLEALGPKAKAVTGAIEALPIEGKSPDPRYASYVPRLLNNLRSNLGMSLLEAPELKGKKKKGRQ